MATERATGEDDRLITVPEDNEPHPSCIVRIWRSVRRSKKTAVLVMFLAFLLDLMLLTAVEPILPEILKGILKTGNNSSSCIANQEVNPNRSDVTINCESGHVSARIVGILNGAKPLAQVILNPVFGVIIDKVGHTTPMMVGFICAFTSTVGFAYGPTFQILLLFRCFQGVGSSLLTISGLTMLSTVYTDPESRSTAMAVAFSGLTFGLIVGFPFGSVLYQFLGREAPFLIMAAMIAAGAILRFCIMPLSLQNKGVTRGDNHCDSFTVCLDPYILVATGIYFWLCYGVGSIMAIAPLFLVEMLGAQQWQIGVIFLVGAVSQTIVQYATSPFSYRIGWWLLSFIGLILVGIGVSTYTVVNSTWMVLLPQCVYAAGIGLVMGSVPALLGYLADVRVDSRYGAVFALSDTGTNTGYFLGSLITGTLVHQFSYIRTFLGTGCVVAIYSLVCLSLRHIPKKSDPLSEEIKQVRYSEGLRRSSRYSFSFSER